MAVHRDFGLPMSVLFRSIRPAAIDHFVGIATSYQPLGRITYSLSVWTSEDALRAFTISPLHRKVMDQYRSRGYPRHIHWWGEFTTIGAGVAEATLRLDAGDGRRVGEATGRWARGDQHRLAPDQTSGRGERHP